MSPIAKALRTGILTIVLAATAVAQPNFTVRHTTLDIGSPWDLVEGLPGVVVIGTNSTILHPTDVDTWTTQTSPASAWLVAVA